MPTPLKRILDKMRDPAWLDRPQVQPQEIGNEAPVQGLTPEDQPLPDHALNAMSASNTGPGYGGPGQEGGVPAPGPGGMLQKKLQHMRMMQQAQDQSGLKPMQTLASGGYGG